MNCTCGDMHFRAWYQHSSCAMKHTKLRYESRACCLRDSFCHIVACASRKEKNGAHDETSEAVCVYLGIENLMVGRGFAGADPLEPAVRV
jgi:hypothetical protein